MKSLLALLLLTVTASAQTSGQYLFQRVGTNGFVNQFITPQTGKYLKFQGGSLVLDTPTGGVADFIFTDSTGIDGTVTNSTSTPTLSLSLTSAAVGLSLVENTALSTWTGGSALTTLGTITAGTWSATNITLAKGGTGNALTDPNADRILFWDDSAGVVTWLQAGNGLTITGTSLAVSDINANVLLGRNNSTGGQPQQITLGTGLTMSGTTLNASVAGIGGTVGTTANAIPKANGTAGNTLQGSGVTIDSSDVIATSGPASGFLTSITPSGPSERFSNKVIHYGFELTWYDDGLTTRTGYLVAPPSCPAISPTWDLPDTSGTLALLSDITGTNSGINTGDQNLSLEAIRTVATNTTATNTDKTILVNASAASVTINLPAAASSNKLRLNIKALTTNGGANTITIDPNGSETIDGSSASLTTTAAYTSWQLHCNGSAWFLVK